MHAKAARAQVADSKFLKAESLLELVKAAMWASGPVMRIAASGERSDIAEVRLRATGHSPGQGSSRFILADFTFSASVWCSTKGADASAET